MASFDDESIIVYQAYNADIAQYACENGRFIGCPSHNHQRMTCKTSHDEDDEQKFSFEIVFRDQDKFSLDDVSIQLGLAIQSTMHFSDLASKIRL